MESRWIFLINLSWTTVLGLLCWQNWLNPPEGLHMPVSGERTPASLIRLQSAGVETVSLGKLAVMDAECSEHSPVQFEDYASRVRLKGRLCSAQQLKSSKIQNTTNGFLATVFYLNDNQFTTDYMSLSEGENHIRVVHELADGSIRRQDVVVTRLAHPLKFER